MEFGTTILGAAIGGVIGFAKGGEGETLKYALWGGGVGLGFTLVCGARSSGFRVGDLPALAPPQSLPDAALPGQLVYNVDPRRDPLLDPVSRERLYPDWIVLHWQHADPKIVALVQQALGVAADGSIGGGTLSALRAFQAHAGLPTTGVLDRQTVQALNL